MESLPVGAVILGLNLAGLERLQGDFPMVPALVVGQAEGSSEAIKLVQAGAFDFLPVPFEEKELVALVGEAVASASDEAGFEIGMSRRGSGRVGGRQSGDGESLSGCGEVGGDAGDGFGAGRDGNGQGAGGGLCGSMGIGGICLWWW